MELIDLSHTIGADMSLYPGSEPPKLEAVARVEADGYAERRVTLLSHTGTHMDAPAHIIAGAPTLDSFPVAQFSGPATLIDVRHRAGQRIEVADLTAQAGLLGDAEFVLLCSGWSQRWGDPSYLAGFPLLSEAAAEWLTAAELKGIGIDMISVDRVGSTTLPIHHILLGAGLLLIENLTRLDRLPVAAPFEFSCFPLPLPRADGAPVRAVARF